MPNRIGQPQGQPTPQREPSPPAAQAALQRAVAALAPTAQPRTVAHANGLTFKVIDGDSNFARVARNVRQLVMADGSTWTVGLPIGWRGTEAAWQPTETPEQAAARIATYGESMARRDRRQLGLHITTPRPAVTR